MSLNFGIFSKIKETLGISDDNNNVPKQSPTIDRVVFGERVGHNTYDVTFLEQSLGLTIEEVECMPVVSRVFPRSEAENFGLMAGDMLVGIAGENISSYDQFSKAISLCTSRPIILR